MVTASSYDAPPRRQSREVGGQESHALGNVGVLGAGVHSNGLREAIG